MPSLLIKDVRIVADVRSENAVKINIHKVKIVLLYAAGDRIDCFVRESHRVEERIHRSLQKLNERFLDRILLRSAEH